MKLQRIRQVEYGYIDLCLVNTAYGIKFIACNTAAISMIIMIPGTFVGLFMSFFFGMTGTTSRLVCFMYFMTFTRQHGFNT